MAERWSRSSIDKLIAAYEHLFQLSVPLSRLRDAAFGGRLFSGSADEAGVPGRSMAWKLFLIPTVPLTPPASQTSANPPLHALRERRKEFVELLLEKMRAPDGSYEEGFSIPGMPTLPRGTSKESSNLQHNNPLSLDDDNPWREWFAAVELRNTIRQDVERTFPDIPYFRDPEVQSQLTNILFIHSATNPNIGYRQGMHELLAPVLYAMDFDSVSEDMTCNEEMKEFCLRTWIAADTWALFGVIMQGVGAWYEWREPPPAPLPLPLKTQFRHGASEGLIDLKPYVAPIVETCQHLQSNLLKAVDPALWKSMHAAGIEPQIYGIRWLRLLFTREFTLPDAMILWDGIIASDTTFDLVPWICISMLIRIRNRLIPSDYSGQLTCLLRYPPPPSEIDSSCPHHANLLLRQALALEMSHNPSTCASIVVENRNLLNIPIEVPEVTPPPMSRRVRSVDRPKSISGDPRVVSPGGSSGGMDRHRREDSVQQSQQMGLPELIARGLLDKGESLGINRTVMNAVSELRKNLPDLTNHLSRSPSSSSSSYTSFPLVDERQSEERPPWEPKTRREMEREISELRTLHKRLAESVGLAVDALLQDESDTKEQDKLKVIHERKREAIECLAYVRDILGGSAGAVEDERLFGEEEYKRRKAKAQKEKEVADSVTSLQRQGGSPDATSVTPSVLPPQPVATGPSAPGERRPRAMMASHDAQHPLSALPRTPSLSRSPPELPTAFTRHSATLPRHGSTSTASSTPALAPWNYTPSNFSSASFDTTALPRPPPRTSTSFLNRKQPSRSGATHVDEHTVGASDYPPPRQEVKHDPLGALP